MIKTIAGVEFEAVRFQSPRPHWRVKVVSTGFIFDAGVFPGGVSQEKLWVAVEYTASLIGHDRFARETLQAQ